MKFDKPPLTYQEQVQLWISRGLSVPDEERAIKYLLNISYYRLSAYALPFQKEKDKFEPGTSFDDIFNLYLFDRELRLFVFNAIERLEVSIRARLIHVLSFKYGSHWQDNPQVFDTPRTVKNRKTGMEYEIDVFKDVQGIITRTTNEKHPETFIKHYKKKYSVPANPPSWMCMEVFTLGQLSKLYNGLRDNKDKQLIASEFGLPHAVFRSWLHTLTYVRNVCGHHSRLWNREISIEPYWLQKPRKLWVDNRFEEVTNRTFYSMCIIKYLLQTANPTHHIKEHLNDLIKKYPNTPIQFMGIPSDENGVVWNWENEPLWK